MNDTLNIDVASRRNSESDKTDDISQRLLKECFLDNADLKKFNPSTATGLHELCFFGDEPAAKPADKPADKKQVTDETVKGYLKSFENLKDNGAANQETLDAFKKCVKNLQDMDQKALEKELTKAAKDPKVEMMLVAMHLKEVLESSGYKKIASDLQRKEGSFVLKHDASETYITVQYNSNSKKEGASVVIESKR